ncbi:MAG: DNA-directed DNA polymerase [Nanoarchaeota archaeon]
MDNKDVKISFYPIDLDFNSHGIVRIFGTTKDGKKICVYDDSLKPYFWVFDDNIDKIKNKINNLELEEEFEILNTKIYDKFYLGKEVKAIKVEVNNVKAVKAISRGLKQDGLDVKEDDINFAKRYLIDKEITPLTLSYVKGELINDSKYDICINGEVMQDKNNQEFYEDLKTLVVDIEVYGSHGGIEKVKNDPILMIGLRGNDIKKVITWKKFKAPEYVEFTDSEAEMIERFIEVVKEYKPDCIVGYFSDGFDFPYIKSRADKYNINLDLGLDGSTVSFKRGLGESTAKIRGILHLDILKFIKKVMAGSLKLDSYSLNVVAQELLHEKKKEIKISEITEAWDNVKGLEEYCEYNLQDTELTLKIFQKIFPNIAELVKLIGISMFDICRMSYGQLVENYLIKRARDFNEIVPSKPTHSNIGERMGLTYQGAFVMKPEIGLYENVVFFDFMSLYPSIIVAKNIDPGTFNREKRGYKTPEITDENGKKVYYYFDSKREGFISQVVKDLIIRRNRIKEILKKERNPFLEARSYALKTVANSSYGMLAFFGARYYCRECAASITAFGREYIQETIKKAQEEGFKVIYSDTDSLAVTLQNKSKKAAQDFLKKINSELPSLMELELENFYPRGIFVSKKSETEGAKKKYALIDEEGKLKITGFETVRKDWSLIARETQLKVLQMILKEGKYEGALKYIKKVIKDVINKKVELDKMIIGVQLKMPLESYKLIGPHVAVARKMKIKGYDVSPGATIYFIISDESGMIRDKAKIPDECKSYDTNYYIENQIIPSVEKIFEVFGIKKEQLMVKEQKSLGEF